MAWIPFISYTQKPHHDSIFMQWKSGFKTLLITWNDMHAHLNLLALIIKDFSSYVLSELKYISQFQLVLKVSPFARPQTGAVYWYWRSTLPHSKATFKRGIICRVCVWRAVKVSSAIVSEFLKCLWYPIILPRHLINDSWIMILYRGENLRYIII